MDDYYNIVYKMLQDGHSPGAVFCYIRRIGYSGILRSLEEHIKMVAFNNFQSCPHSRKFQQLIWLEGVTVIKRNEVLKYMTIRDKESMADINAAKYYEILKKKISD